MSKAQGSDCATLEIYVRSRPIPAEQTYCACGETVKAIAIGSGIRFEDRGEHVLKGVPEKWHRYALGE